MFLPYSFAVHLIYYLLWGKLNLFCELNRILPMDLRALIISQYGMQTYQLNEEVMPRGRAGAEFVDNSLKLIGHSWFFLIVVLIIVSYMIQCFAVKVKYFLYHLCIITTKLQQHKYLRQFSFLYLLFSFI